MRPFHPSLTLLIVFVLMAAVLPAQAQGGPTPTPAGLGPDVLPYGVPGPYAVGTTKFVFEKGTDKALFIIAWYPAQKQSVATLVVPEVNDALATLGESDAAIRNAALDTSHAPYPLVVFSHGFTASPAWYTFLEAHLASWGFVVLAPIHAGETFNDYYPGIAQRLLVVKRTIQDAETLTAAGGALQGAIDTEHIAVGGHSSGGSTAYGAAGASLNWPVIEQYCTENRWDPGCKNLSAQKKAMQTVIGVDASPDGMWPAIWDPRVKAILPLAGSIEPYGKAGLAEITVPMMAMLGSADLSVPAKWSSTAYDQVSSTQKAQVVFVGADHGVFTTADDPVWRKSQAQPLINHFATAFLLDLLKGDKDAHKALLPDAVKFAGIEYKTTMK